MAKLTLPLSEVLSAYVGVEALSQRPLKPASSIRVARLLVALNRERRTYEATRGELVNRLGKPSKEEPGKTVIPAEDQDSQREYWEAVIEMQGTEIVLDVEFLTENDLVELEPKFVVTILPFLVDIEEDIQEEG